jgi:hypothetical protein
MPSSEDRARTAVDRAFATAEPLDKARISTERPVLGQKSSQLPNQYQVSFCDLIGRGVPTLEVVTDISNICQVLNSYAGWDIVGIGLLQRIIKVSSTTPATRRWPFGAGAGMLSLLDLRPAGAINGRGQEAVTGRNP